MTKNSKSPPKKRKPVDVRIALLPPATKQVLDDLVQETDVHLQDILGTSKERRISRVRQEAMRRLRDIPAPWGGDTSLYSYPDLGNIFGRDHTTIMHGVGQARQRLGEKAPDAGAIRRVG